MKPIMEDIYNIYSVSSAEVEINKYLKDKYKDGGFEVIQDKLYSIFLKKSGSSNKKVMIGFPLDEYGLMVREIDSDNKIKFILLEDVSPLVFINQRVNIVTKDYSNIKAVVCIDRKLAESTKTDFSVDDLYLKPICSREKAKSISIGDLVSLESPLLREDNYLVGRSLNQKIFQYLSVDLLDEISKRDYSFELYLGGISQSTIGFRGTKTATYLIKPDVAIALTGFEVNSSKPTVKLGDGVIVGHYDKQMLPNKSLLNFIRDKFSTKPYVGFRGNDGSFIHKTIEGSKTVSMGIPVLNLSTANEMIDINDLNNLKKSILELLDHLEEYVREL